MGSTVYSPPLGWVYLCVVFRELFHGNPANAHLREELPREQGVAEDLQGRQRQEGEWGEESSAFLSWPKPFLGIPIIS